MIRSLIGVLSIVLAFASGVRADSLYDFDVRSPGVDAFAYEGDDTQQLPAASGQPASELKSGDYSKIAQDDKNSHSSQAKKDGRYVQQRFRFLLRESPGDITSLELTWKGAGENSQNGEEEKDKDKDKKKETGKSARTDGVSLYAFDYSANQWQLLITSTSDKVQTLSASISTQPGQFVDADNDNAFDLLVVSNDVRDQAKSVIETNYVSLVVKGNLPPATLRGDWRLDRFGWTGAAGEVEDSSGNGRDGRSIGPLPSADSRTGLCQAADLSAKSESDGILLPRAAFDGLEDFTLGFWLNTAVNKGRQQILDAPGDSYKDEELGVALNGKEKLRIDLLGSGRDLKVGKNALTDGQWHQLLITRYGKQICLWIDGTQSVCDTKFSSGALSLSFADTVLGQRFDDKGKFKSGSDFRGLLDEVLLFDRSLTADEISTLYARQVAGKNSDGSDRVCPDAPQPSPYFRLEAGSVELEPGTSVTVPFRQYYADPPAVFLTVDSANPDPTVARILEVNSDGFRVAVIEAPGANGGADQRSEVHYLVAEKGLHRFPDGTLIEVGELTLDAVQGKGGNAQWARLPFLAGFVGTPALVAEIQSLNSNPGLDPSQGAEPWLTVALRNLDKDGVDMALERSRTDAGTVMPERVAYLALEAKAIAPFADLDGRLVSGEGVVTDDNVRGWPGCYMNGFSPSVFSGPPLMVADKVSRDGSHGGWLRRCSLSADSFGTVVDKELYSNRSHTTEKVGAVAFSAPFAADFSLKASYLFDICNLEGDPVVPDASGNGNHATALNGAETTSGKVCKAALLDGEDDYFSAPDSDLVDDTEQLTIMLWFNAAELDQKNGTNARGLFSKRDTSSSQNSYGAFFWNGKGPYLWFDLDSSNNRFRSNGSFSTNRWYHLAMVFDGRKPVDERVSIYVDGKLDRVAPESSSRLPNFGSKLYIGNLFWPNELKVFKGMLDEFKLFRRALSAQEIVNHMGQSRLCAFCSPQVDHYRITAPGQGITCEPSSVTVTAWDSSGNPVVPAAGTVVTLTSNQRDTTLTPASYTFGGSESSFAVSVAQPTPKTVNLNVSDGSASEDSGHDPDIDFAEAVLKFWNADTGTDLLPTLVSGRPSDDPSDAHQIELRAIVTDPDTGACTARVSGTQAVSLSFTCVDPASCVSGQNFTVDDLNGNEVALPGSVTLDFDANGRAPIPLRYTDAGQVRLSASLDLPEDTSSAPPKPAVKLSGTSSVITVKPAGICVEVTAANSQCASQDGSCSVFRQAGESFPLTVKAVSWQSDGEADAALCDNAVTPNYQASNILLTHSHAISDAAASWADGSLGVGTVAISSGGAVTEPDQTISEVGVFTITATPPQYFGEAIAPSASAPIGRFTPGFFTLSGGTLVHRADLGGGASFSYLGEPMRAEFDILPWALGADPAVDAPLQNYQGSFGKLSAFDDLGLGAADASAGVSLSGRIESEPGFSLAPEAGKVVVAAPFRVARGSAPDGPFESFALGAAVTDGDGVGLRSSDFNLDTDLDSAADRVQIGPQGALRYGRIAVVNAFGPETEDLTQEVRAEYWNGSSFVLNQEDSQTGIGPLLNFSDLSGSLIADGLAPVHAASVASGSLSVAYPAPGAGNQGQIGLRVDLSTLPWLRWDWDNDSNADDWDSLDEDAPYGSATLGRYRGNDRVIFWQENSLR